MQIFYRIWSDIKSGENIDLFITVVVAIVLVLLNVIGIASQALLAPITLAVLGLLALTMLGNRYRIEELGKKLEKTNSSFFHEEFPLSLKDDIEMATELWLVGVSLSSTIKNNYQRIEQKLLRGDRVKVLLVHPNGPGLEMAVSRNYAQRDVEQKGNDIRNSLNYLCLLKHSAPDRLQIRTIQNPLGYGAFAINPNSSSGVIYIENYPYRIVSAAMPKFVMRSTDGKWYEFFYKELSILWETATEWSCTKQDD